LPQEWQKRFPRFLGEKEGFETAPTWRIIPVSK